MVKSYLVSQKTSANLVGKTGHDQERTLETKARVGVENLILLRNRYHVDMHGPNIAPRREDASQIA